MWTPCVILPNLHLMQTTFDAQGRPIWITCENIWIWQDYYIDGSVQNCSNSIANTLELLQSCTKPTIYPAMQSISHNILLCCGCIISFYQILIQLTVPDHNNTQHRTRSVHISLDVPCINLTYVLSLQSQCDIFYIIVLYIMLHVRFINFCPLSVTTHGTRSTQQLHY